MRRGDTLLPRCDGWRARGQTDPVEVGANGQGLGQCGDDLHFSATCGAFRHIDTEDPGKQACLGEAVDRLGCRGLLGVNAALLKYFLWPGHDAIRLAVLGASTP